MKRIAALLTLFIFLTELPSCSFSGFSAQNLMSPPKANADQQSIYRLLQGAQTEVTLIYPKNGEYRSAIIMCDFTGDGVEDAIGFCATGDGGSQVQFLTKVEGEWTAAAAFPNPASQVDRVCFGSLPGGGQAVFIGWGSTAGTTGRLATACAYLYKQNGYLIQYSLGSYGEMAVTDFDGDGVNELFTIDKSVSVPNETEGEEITPARACLYAFDGDEPYEAAWTEADNSVSGYSGVAFGRMSAKDWGVVVDGTTADGSMNTQVFFMEDGRLVNYPRAVNTEGYVNEYTRPAAAAITSRDINGDGYINIPSAIQLPGLSEDMVLDSTSYMVEWRSQTPGNSSRVVLRALMNVRENYWFRLPYSLQGRLCAVNDVERRTVTYTEVKSTEEEGLLLGGTLFSIRAFTRSAWESRGETSGYTMLIEQNDSVYGIQVNSRDEQVERAAKDIMKSFSLLDE